MSCELDPAPTALLILLQMSAEEKVLLVVQNAL